MSEKPIIDESNVEGDEPDQSELKSRREFLSGLGRWSAIIIGGVNDDQSIGLQRTQQPARVPRVQTEPRPQ